MSNAYENQDPLAIAKQAERDLNSHDAKQGRGGSDSTNESGINEAAASRFPGGSVSVGSTGQGNNRTIPLDEGGDVNPVTGKMYKARDFEGEGGPEDKARAYAENYGGENDVQGNIRDHSTADRSGGGGHVKDVTSTGVGKGTDVQ